MSQEVSVNGIKTSTLVIFFYLAFFSVCSPAFAGKTVTILYSGCAYGGMYATPE